MIELLNYFDFVATAYSQKVADNSIVLTAFKGPMSTWFNILRNFINAVEGCEGYQPWKAYVDLIAEWNRSGSAHREATA